MSGLLSGENEWSSSYARLDTAEDYIEWTFTLTSGEAAILNEGGAFAWSARITNPNPDEHLVFVNGWSLGARVENFSGFSNGYFTWGAWLYMITPSSHLSTNVYFTGTNTLRVQTLPGLSGPLDIDFLALELDMSDFGTPILPPNDFYTSTERSRFSLGADTPNWFAGHTNPTYDHSSADYPAGAEVLSSESHPTFILKAPDGTIGHATETAFEITAVRTSSNSPLTSPLVLDCDITATNGGTGTLRLAQVSPSIDVDLPAGPDSGGKYDTTSTITLSGGSGSFTANLPLNPPSTDAGTVYVYFDGDSTHYSFGPASITATAFSPVIVDLTITNINRYTFHFVPVYQADISTPGSYVAYSQIPTNIYWNATNPDVFLGFGAGDASGATFTHEYDHHHDNYSGMLVTSGDYDPYGGPDLLYGASTWIFNVETGFQLGWLHFSDDKLTDPTFLPFTGTPFDINVISGSTLFGIFDLETNGTNGYVLTTNLANEFAEIRAFPPSGGAQVSSAPGTNYPLYCFAADHENVYGISGSFPGPDFELMYGPLSSLSPLSDLNADMATHNLNTPIDMVVDDSTGFLYILWIDNADELMKVTQIDSSGTVTLVYAFGGDGIVVATNIDAAGGVLVASGIDPPALSSVIWIVDAATGSGAEHYAFTTGIADFISGLTFNGGVGGESLLRQTGDVRIAGGLEMTHVPGDTQGQIVSQ